MSFDRDDANIEHIARHGVDPEEAEEALTDPDAVPARSYPGPGGDWRGAVVGQALSGRYLMVVYTQRPGGLRILSAREADDGEKRRYRR